MQFRWRYQSDGGVAQDGAFIDDIEITVDGTTVLSDDVEEGDNDWSADGFTRMTGSTSEEVQRVRGQQHERSPRLRSGAPRGRAPRAGDLRGR